MPGSVKMELGTVLVKKYPCGRDTKVKGSPYLEKEQCQHALLEHNALLDGGSRRVGGVEQTSQR